MPGVSRAPRRAPVDRRQRHRQDIRVHGRRCALSDRRPERAGCLGSADRRGLLGDRRPVPGRDDAVPDTRTSNFIFDAEDGTISAWRGGSRRPCVLVPATPGASYKGLAISNGTSGPRLTPADFGTDPVDVFDGSWNNVTTPGSLRRPALPKGFAPFGIQTIGTRVFVTYGIQGPDGDELDRPAAGIVESTSLDGVFLHRVASHDVLNAPWGLAQAPAGWGALRRRPARRELRRRAIQRSRSSPTGASSTQATSATARLQASVDGLWALEFGESRASNGNRQTLLLHRRAQRGERRALRDDQPEELTPPPGGGARGSPPPRTSLRANVVFAIVRPCRSNTARSPAGRRSTGLRACRSSGR